MCVCVYFIGFSAIFLGSVDWACKSRFFHLCRCEKLNFQQYFPACEPSRVPPPHKTFQHVWPHPRTAFDRRSCLLAVLARNFYAFFVASISSFALFRSDHPHTQCSHIYGQWLDAQRSSPKKSYFMHSHSGWPLIYGARCSSIERTERMRCTNWARNRVRYATMRQNYCSFRRVRVTRAINCCRSKKAHSTLPCKVKVPFNRLSCRATTFWTKSGKSSAAVSVREHSCIVWAIVCRLTVSLGFLDALPTNFSVCISLPFVPRTLHCSNSTWNSVQRPDERWRAGIVEENAAADASRIR